MIIALIIIWLFWISIMGIYIMAGQSFYLCLFPLIICSGIGIALSYISDYASIGFALLFPCYYIYDLLKTKKSKNNKTDENISKTEHCDD